MEPLLPDLQSAELAELSQKTTLAIGELNAHLPSAVVRDRVSQLVRKMNCYYSNLIEGHKTLPRISSRPGGNSSRKAPRKNVTSSSWRRHTFKPKRR